MPKMLIKTMRPSLRLVTQRHPVTLCLTHCRLNSSEPVPKEVSPHIGFYQVFGRPIAKVLLMATFTYQLSYWLWVKLEKDELKKDRTTEIFELETRLRELSPRDYGIRVLDPTSVTGFRTLVSHNVSRDTMEAMMENQEEEELTAAL